MKNSSLFSLRNWLPLLAAASLLFGIPLFFSGIVLRFPIDRQIFFAWSVLVVVFITKKIFGRFSVFFGIFLSLCTLWFLVCYLSFRIGWTLIYTSPLEFILVLLLFLAELYGMLIQVMGMIVNVMPLRRPIQPVDLKDPGLPVVDVLIPTYNEPEQMVAITASACTLLDYPREKLNVFILDDGGTVQKRNDPDPEKAAAALARHETLQILAQYLEVGYLTREKNISAKAGNINEALYGEGDTQVRPRGDLVLILDCDHVPTRDFLKNTVGYFQQDPKLFLVQTPHFFINPDPVAKNLHTFEQMPGDNMMFYLKVLPGLDLWNGAFFCGSAAVLRRSCLDEVGGIVGETITEDAETSLAMHSRGYNSVYVGKPMVCGLCPETFEDFIIQRNRWAQGMVQILLLKNPLFVQGLTVIQRLCYLNSCGFWFFSFSRLAFMLAPFCFLYGNVQVYHATLLQCLAFPIPYIVMSMMLSNFMYGAVRHPFFSELYETVMSFYNIPAIISVLRNPHSPQFTVTPKDTSLEKDAASPLATPFYLLLVFFFPMYPVALLRAVDQPLLLGTVILCTIWGTFNLIMILLCLGVVWERKEIRQKYRIPVQESVRVRIKDEEGADWLPGLATDLSEEGVGIMLFGRKTFSENTMVEIETIDSVQQRFLFTARIVRVSRDREQNRTQLGCEYQFEDEESFLAITNHLYGASDRWEQFWIRQQQPVSIFAGFFGIFKLGVFGAVQHFSGLVRLGWKNIRSYQEEIWSRCVGKCINRPG